MKITDDMRHVYLTVRELDLLLRFHDETLKSDDERTEVTRIMEYLRRTMEQEC